ncbi:DUF4296 domain-containing protein [Flagellimonas sp.]|uniref:DUF4296 domain-containing protein n=1 Tax=Flagellimonas sp. TaxID=2058762 RepID=UPI003F4A7BC3
MKKALILFLGCLIVGCAQKVIEPPENLIPESKMVDILHDLAILTAAKKSFAYVLDNNNVEAMDFIFQKYQIDSTQFAQSDKYYASIPLQYQMIYEKVEVRLEKKRKALEEENTKRNDSTRAAQQKRSDSLRNLRKDTIPSS